MSSDISRTYLVTGANRGIGFALTKTLLARNQKVIATARDPEGDASKELRTLKEQHPDLRIEPLEVTSTDSARQLYEGLHSAGIKINVLVNNAGFLKNGLGKFESVSAEEILEHIQVNTLGPHRVTQALLPLLASSEDGRPALIATVSSTVGSLGGPLVSADYTAYGYRISKTAVNMWNRQLSLELQSKNIIAVVLCPGWVQTAMGGPNAALTPETSANNIVNNILEKVTIEDTGKYLGNTGDIIPW